MTNPFLFQVCSKKKEFCSEAQIGTQDKGRETNGGFPSKWDWFGQLSPNLHGRHLRLIGAPKSGVENAKRGWNGWYGRKGSV